MKLSTRLLLLTAGCLLPIVAAQIYSQTALDSRRHQERLEAALHRAVSVDTDIVSALNSVRQLGSYIDQFPQTRTDVDACRQHLNALRKLMTAFRFLALAIPGQAGTACASDGFPARNNGPGGRWLADVSATKDLVVGPIVADPAGGFLPVAIYRPQSGSASPVLLIGGLDVGWLSHLQAVTQAVPAEMHARLFVAAHDGTLLTQLPGEASNAAQQLPDWLRPVAQHNDQGVQTVIDGSGTAFLAAYGANAATPQGPTVIDLVPVRDLAPGIDRATGQGLVVIIATAALTIALAWIVGRRFMYRPIEMLLQAARRWREGDLSARANLVEAGSEFSALADSFNAMAVGLAARESERRMQASFLESQVAERTRELSETNNRLQVEIAGREKTEAALHQAQKLQAVGQLAGGIAHDYNNMLATVLGNLELMERRVAQAAEHWSSSEAERLQRLIERAVGAVQRGSQLTSRLLAFSRRQRLAARPTDINALLQELITLATSTLGRRIQVVSELKDELWLAMVDPSQLEAAILNLCLNARDAMPEGGRLTIGTTNVSVRAGLHPDIGPGDYIQVCIADTGIGMTDEIRARAFDPFFTTKGPGAGSGLGLSQVYGMARQSGGAVSLDSTPDAGTRVTLHLPRAADSGATAGAAQTQQPAARTQSGKVHELVLVVDDDHAVRQVTVEMARDLGCEVAQASGGEQALALMAKLSPPPRIILLDYAMPGMNGLQLARALRERGVTAPIALVTGYAELSEADIRSGELAGLLRKPFTIRELQVLLQQLRAGSPPSPTRIEADVSMP